MEASGVLRKVNYVEWAAPIVPVPKKDGTICICGDYKVTINPYLHQGLYEFSQLPFGVASAPAVFQKAMDGILQGILHYIRYLVDILVTGRSDVEHLQNLEKVLQCLQEQGVRLKKEKCSLFQDSVEYLGYTINAKGIHTTNKKVKAILDAPSPRNLSELRSFLGLLNYYSRFLPNITATLHPLHTSLRAGQPWMWSQNCEAAFQAAKEALVGAPILAHYDPDLPISLGGDASAYGVGDVISHTMQDSTERPLAFASRTLTASE